MFLDSTYAFSRKILPSMEILMDFYQMRFSILLQQRWSEVVGLQNETGTAGGFLDRDSATATRGWRHLPLHPYQQCRRLQPEDQDHGRDSRQNYRSGH